MGMPMLFDYFDSDKDGELDLQDFQFMIESMHIGLSNERAIELFETFDADGGGSIDALELVRHVFPDALKKFQEVYGETEVEEVAPSDSLEAHRATSTVSRSTVTLPGKRQKSTGSW